jgi:hypothetical protein
VKLKQFSYDKESWCGTVVDARRAKPAGHKAHLHFLLWEKACAVINGPWCHANVSLLMHPHFTPWKWLLNKDNSPFSKSCGKLVCASQSTVPRTMTIKFGEECGMGIVGLCTAREASMITRCVTHGSKKHFFCGLLFDDNTATIVTNQADMPEAAFVAAVVKQFVTITIDEKHLRATLGKHSACVLHGQCLDGRSVYATAIMDKKCDLYPCWSIV